MWRVQIVHPILGTKGLDSAEEYTEPWCTEPRHGSHRVNSHKFGKKNKKKKTSGFLRETIYQWWLFHIYGTYVSLPVYLIYSNPIQSIYMQRTNTWSTPMHCKPGTKQKKTSHPTVVASQGSSATHEVHILKGNRPGEKTWDIYRLIEMNNKGIWIFMGY